MEGYQPIGARTPAHPPSARSFCSFTLMSKVSRWTLCWGHKVRIKELESHNVPEMDVMRSQGRRKPWAAKHIPRPNHKHRYSQRKHPLIRASLLDTTAHSSFGSKCDSQCFKYLWCNGLANTFSLKIQQLEASFLSVAHICKVCVCVCAVSKLFVF